MSAPSHSVLILGYVGPFAHHLIDRQRGVLCVARLHHCYQGPLRQHIEGSAEHHLCAPMSEIRNTQALGFPLSYVGV